MAIGHVSYRTLGRKRVLVSNDVEASSPPRTPLKRMCSGKFSLNSDRSRLEALPQDILVQVLCGVDHEDLEQLFHVSKVIREATVIAKKFHFKYKTPMKQTVVFHTSLDMENENGFHEIEPPNAPLRKSRSRLNGRKLAGISVALFTSIDEEK